MAASQAGSRHSGSDSQSRKRKQQPQDTAVSSQGGLHPVPNGKAAQKAAKRQRLAATAVVDTPQTTGSAAESQPELTPAEKREMRIKRREQRQMSQLVRYGVLPAGRHEFLFKNSRTCEVEVFPDGDILYQGELYDSLARLGKALLEESSTGRQSCNCWRDITWQGDKMETLRQAAHNKYLQAKKFQRK
ncbi:hypothetical protein WJX79_008634 [Trebouxia sp. C0005]